MPQAFDTYFSQSFGAGNFTAFGTWLIVGSIVLAGVAVPVTLVLIFCEVCRRDARRRRCQLECERFGRASSRSRVLRTEFCEQSFASLPAVI